jgi:hypothetical protein
MATQFTVANGSAYLQKMYSPRVITNTATMLSSESLKLIRENTAGGGSDYNFLADNQDLVSGSADETTAFAYSTTAQASVGAQYSVPWFQDLFVTTVAGALIARVKNQPLKWTKALDKAMKSCINMSAFRTSLAWVTEGWGEIGQINTVSGFTFKPVDTSQIHRYIPGGKIVFSSSLNAAVLRSATAITITDVDYQTFIVTCDTTLATPGGTNNDFAFYAGDRQNSATPARQRPAGLAAWLPNSATKKADSTISTLYGVARKARDFGNLIDGTTGTVASAFVRAAQAAKSFGNATKLAGFCSPNKYTDFSEMLAGQNRSNTIELKGRGGYGHRYLTVYVDGLEMGVGSDKFMDDTTAYCLDLDCCWINSIGPVPHVDNDDGNTMLRVAGARAVEIRLVQDFNFTIENPAACSIINWVSVA